MKWIEIIYSHPTASVITNQNISCPFAINRGTRQGCPLSPCLFSIIIEPLAASVRQSQLISPVEIHEQEHHLSLYADDILLFISRPETSIPALLTLISSFGKLSGFSVNWDKSELMPVSKEVNMTYLLSLPLKRLMSIFHILVLLLRKNLRTSYERTGTAKLNSLSRELISGRLFLFLS